ncbi:MAG: dethiobiotin synthase [Gaiellales bacterium]
MSLPLLDAFVTGTGSGVGKTVVCARMAAEARARGLVPGVLKAVQTGEDDDALWVGNRVPGTIAATVYSYDSPLAPAIAARIDREPPVQIATIVEAVAELRRHCDGVIVEGSGGLFEPLVDRLTFADLARALDLPVIIVCRPGPSTLNHTALTIAAARHAGLAIAGLAVCGASADPDIGERSALEELSRLATVLEVILHDAAWADGGRPRGT